MKPNLRSEYAVDGHTDKGKIEVEDQVCSDFSPTCTPYPEKDGMASSGHRCFEHPKLFHRLLTLAAQRKLCGRHKVETRSYDVLIGPSFQWVDIAPQCAPVKVKLHTQKGVLCDTLEAECGIQHCVLARISRQSRTHIPHAYSLAGSSPWVGPRAPSGQSRLCPNTTASVFSGFNASALYVVLAGQCSGMSVANFQPALWQAVGFHCPPFAQIYLQPTRLKLASVTNVKWEPRHLAQDACHRIKGDTDKDRVSRRFVPRKAPCKGVEVCQYLLVR